MDILPEFCSKRVLILGCGNILLGDDGLGPSVVEHLREHYQVPEDVCLMDAGTGVRKILFTLGLSETHPEELVIVDAVNRGQAPGSVMELEIEDIPLEKIDDFSMHQAPASNLLRELRGESGMRISVFACDVGEVEPRVQPGLSELAQNAVPVIGQRIAERYFNQERGN